MRNFLIGFVVFLFYCSFARWHYVCEIRNLCQDKQLESVATTNEIAEIPERKKDLSLKADDVTILADYEQFGFLPNSAELQLTDNNKEYLAGIAKYLKENPDAELKVIGYYFPDETLDSNSMYDNLGLARAAAVRDYLENEHNIRANSVQVDYQVVDEKTFREQPLTYSITTQKPPTTKGDKDEGLAKASYTFTRMTFSDINFEYNSAEFKPSQNFVTYADSVQRYLELNPDKTLTIIGHTDSKGRDDYNYGLGLTRAKNVIVFLKDKSGIKVEKMDAKSEGEKKPIAPNDTEANRRKNRRVEVVIN